MQEVTKLPLAHTFPLQVLFDLLEASVEWKWPSYRNFACVVFRCSGNATVNVMPTLLVIIA